MADYLPLFRPGQTVTFSAAAAITGGQALELGAVGRSVVPAAAGSNKYVGVAGHDAGVGDKVTVEVSKPIHELTAVGAVAVGEKVETAAGGRVRTATTGTVVGLALTAAADGAALQVLQA